MGKWGEMRMKEKRPIEKDIHNTVSPRIGSVALNCGGGLSGFCPLTVNFKF